MSVDSADLLRVALATGVVGIGQIAGKGDQSSMCLLRCVCLWVTGMTAAAGECVKDLLPVVFVAVALSATAVCCCRRRRACHEDEQQPARDRGYVRLRVMAKAADAGQPQATPAVHSI